MKITDIVNVGTLTKREKNFVFEVIRDFISHCELSHSDVVKRVNKCDYYILSVDDNILFGCSTTGWEIVFKNKNGHLVFMSKSMGHYSSKPTAKSNESIGGALLYVLSMLNKIQVNIDKIIFTVPLGEIVSCRKKANKSIIITIS